MQDSKERRDKIHKLLNDLAKSTAIEATWIRELLDLLFEDAKERLVDAMGDDIPRIQGEAKVMERIAKQLNAATALLRKQ